MKFIISTPDVVVSHLEIHQTSWNLTIILLELVVDKRALLRFWSFHWKLDYLRPVQLTNLLADLSSLAEAGVMDLECRTRNYNDGPPWVFKGRFVCFDFNFWRNEYWQ
jgi:hypothetical protein